ncbi:MAG: cupin domain-containing protein, partial [Acidimicrobiia bacterium]
RMDAGYARDWHPAPRRQFVFVSKGEVELRVSDGEVRRFGTGSVVLAEDTTGNGHQTRAAGAGDCVVVWVACP